MSKVVESNSLSSDGVKPAREGLGIKSLLSGYASGLRHYAFADFGWEDLQGVKDLEWCIWLSVDYDMIGVVVKGEIMIFSGCRMFTLKEAEEHWREGAEEEWTVSSPEWGEERRRGLARIRNKLDG